MTIKLVGGPPNDPNDPQKILAELTAMSLHGDEILELAALPVDWVWEPSFASGSTITIGGPPSSGKSSLLFRFLVARAHCHPIEVLGRTVTPAPDGRFIFIIEEESRRRTARRIQNAIKSFGLDELSTRRVIKRFRFLTSEHSVMVGDGTWLKIGKLVAAGLVSDIVIDTLANSTTEDGNSEKEQASLYKKFKRVLALYPKDSELPEPLLWLLAHTKKGEAEDWSSALAGSRQRAAQTDCLLMLEAQTDKDESHIASICHIAKERDNMDLPSSKPIKFDAQGIVVERKAGRPATKLSISIIIEAIRKAGKINLTDLSEALHARRESVEVFLKQAVEKNLVKVEKGVKNAIQHEVFSIPSEIPPSPIVQR